MTRFVKGARIDAFYATLASEIEDSWRTQACSTAHFEEVTVRTAISELGLEATGRRPAAVIALSSPFECMVATAFMRGAVSSHGIELFTAMPPSDADKLRASLGHDDELAKASKQLGRTVWRSHLNAISDALDTALARYDWDNIGASTRQIVAARVADQCDATLTEEVRAALFRPTGRAKSLPTTTGFPWRGRPQLDVSMGQIHSWLAQYDLAIAAGLQPHQDSASARLVECLRQACSSCSWFWFAGDVVFVSDWPEVVRLDEKGRSHGLDVPAIRYRDGFEVYSLNGMEIAPRLIVSPDETAVQMIEAENNLERRRVMIKAMGVERYLALSGAVRVHEDETGVLWKRSFPVTNAADVRRPLRSLCFVEVLNGTIEPDGTRKRYFLRVPPGMLTARAAVAWSYSLSERDYVPLART